MEAFSIECTTCQAVLRVRDASAIGQILTCPKCGSMVLVEPPPGFVTADPPAAATPETAMPEAATPEAATPETAEQRSDSATAVPADEDSSAAPANVDVFGDGDSQSVVKTAPPSPVPRRRPARGAGEMADTVEDLSLYGTRLPESSSLLARKPAERVLEEEPYSPAPEQDWSSDAPRRWRNSLLAGGTGLLGVVLAIGLFSMIAGQGENPPAASSTDATAQETTDEEAGGIELGPSPDTSQPPSSGDRQVSAGPSADAPKLAQSTSDAMDTRAADGGADDADAKNTGTADVGAGDRSPEDRSPEDPGSEIARSEPDAANPDEPAVAARAADDLADAPPGLMAPRDSAASDAAVDLDEVAREFAALLDTPSETPATATDATATDATATDGAPTEEVPDAVEVEERERPHRPPPRVVDVPARLGDSFVSIEFDGRLGPFLDFVGDFSTIPISLDANVLPWMRLTPNSAVRVPRSEATVAEVLHTGLTPLGLGHTQVGDQLVVGRAADPGELRSVPYRVDDLASDDAEVAQLADWIRRLVAPASWRSAGGSGEIVVEGTTLNISQTDAVHFGAIRFCEMLRVARGLPPRSSFPAKLFELTSRTERARENLARPVSVTFLEPAPLQRIVRYLGDAGKTHLLVDWVALAEEGWTPDAAATFTATNEPLGTALNRLLAPLGLAYRVIDQDLLQVTTRSQEAGRVELEFYPIAAESAAREFTAEDWRRKVQDWIGVEHFAGGGGPGDVEFDAPSRCVLVSLPQEQQRRIAKKLAEFAP